MKLNLFLIFFCFCSSVSFGQENLSNDIESVYVNKRISPKLQKILFRSKQTGEIVSEFDVNENNPFADIDRPSVKSILEKNTNFQESEIPFIYRTHCTTIIPSRISSLSYKTNKHICIWYRLYVKKGNNGCGERETLYSTNKLLVIDNNGNTVHEIDSIENCIINNALVSEDGNYLIYNYSDSDYDTGEFKKAGFVLFNLYEHKVEYDYRSDIIYNRDVGFVNITSGSIFQILTTRESRDEEGVVAYIDTENKQVYELKLPNEHTNRSISSTFENDGLYFVYKDGSKGKALLKDFTKTFCWK